MIEENQKITCKRKMGNPWSLNAGTYSFCKELGAKLFANQENPSAHMRNKYGDTESRYFIRRTTPRIL
jgi:hypothetical protein